MGLIQLGIFAIQLPTQLRQLPINPLIFSLLLNQLLIMLRIRDLQLLYPNLQILNNLILMF